MYIKKIVIAFFLATILLFPNFVFAANDATYGAGAAASKAGLPSSIAGESSPAAVVGKVINVALSFVGIVFFVLVLYSGFIWMTAMGNTEQVTKAKNIIEAAVIGLVLVGAAYAVSNFVFTQLAGGGTVAVETPAVTCTGSNVGVECGTRKVCNASNSCVDKCLVTYADKNPACVEESDCIGGRVTVVGLCSNSSASIKCCHD